MSQHESHFSPQTQRPTTASSPTSYQPVDVVVSESEIAKLAFAKFEARGCAHGLDKEDWEAASRELGAKAHGRGHPAGVTPLR
jgi:hypothetical protein